MTDTQLYLAIGVSVVSNAILLTLFSSMVNSRLSSIETAGNKRFDDMRELWRTELRGFQGEKSVWPTHSGGTSKSDAVVVTSLGLTF